MSAVKVQIALSLLVLSCAQILCWRRRDNIAGYLAGGLFFVSTVVPLFGTSVLAGYEPALIGHYANVVTVGALFFLVGIGIGAHLGSFGRRPPVTFDRPLPVHIPRRLVNRTRWAAAGGVFGMLAAFKLLGYVPLFAANRQLAKYGAGPYRAGFERGSLVYHLALSLASTVLPVALAVAYRRRRRLDVLLCGLLVLGLAATLNRGTAFTGPLIFLAALAVERRIKPSLILVGVCFAFVAGTLANELIYDAPPASSPSFAQRVTATAPDVVDHLGFLRGFELQGRQYTGTKTIQAGWSLGRSKGEYDASQYALRIVTGASDLSDLASGGARLPAPIWGYAAYGFAGCAAWSLIAGLFSGWGTALVRRLVTTVQRAPGQSLNLILAHVFYTGTFGVASSFFFPQRANIVPFGLAIALGVSLTSLRADRGTLQPMEKDPASGSALAQRTTQR